MSHTRGDETSALPRPDLEALESGPFDVEAVRLRVGHCAVCGTETAPPAVICFSCGSVDIDIRLDEGRGTLYSFTTVHISPNLATPYVLGYVDLPGGLRVLGHVVAPADQLRCDLPVRVAAVADGASDWAFVPMEEEAAR